MNATLEVKWCSKCKEHPSASTRGGRCLRCKNELNKLRGIKNPGYHRAKYLENKYGISLDDYDQMLLNQEYGCAICGGKESRLSENLIVDHDHQTGEIRGLL